MNDCTDYELAVLATILDEASVEGRSPEFVKAVERLKEDVQMTRYPRCRCILNPKCPHFPVIEKSVVVSESLPIGVNLSVGEAHALRALGKSLDQSSFSQEDSVRVAWVALSRVSDRLYSHEALGTVWTLSRRVEK